MHVAQTERGRSLTDGDIREGRNARRKLLRLAWAVLVPKASCRLSTSTTQRDNGPSGCLHVATHE